MGLVEVPFFLFLLSFFFSFLSFLFSFLSLPLSIVPLDPILLPSASAPGYERARRKKPSMAERKVGREER